MTVDNVANLKLCLKMCFLFWCSILSLYTLLCFLRKSWKSSSTGSFSWSSMANSPMGFRDIEAPSLPWDLLSMFQHHLSWLTAINRNMVNYTACSYVVFAITLLHFLIGIDNPARFLIQSEINPDPFYHASRRLQIVVFSFNRSTGLSVSSVLRQSHNSDFGFIDT